MTANLRFQRLEMLTGANALAALSEAKVLVFGLGGVGSWAAEALVRSGVEHITLVDFDTVDITNINRQIEAATSTIGQSKAAALAARLGDINPDCVITPVQKFFSCKDEGIEKTAANFGIPKADYIIDAIDSLESKLDLIEAAARFNVKLFSSMGMALKLDPTRLKTVVIWKTSGCALARNVREGLRKRGFNGNFTVVYSDEKIAQQKNDDYTSGKKINGSAVTVTAAAGMILASLVVNDICKQTNAIQP